MGSSPKKPATSESELRSGKILAALFYAVSSLGVILINKIVLTNYGFPYFTFLAAVQFSATSIIMVTLIYLRKIDIPPLTASLFTEIAPISVMFLGNVVSGLGSTKSLNLPMFTALRRFSILMTMCGEYFLLNKSPCFSVVISVLLMVGGAVVAAYYDLAFDLYGYSLVLTNDLFTALCGIYMKKASTSAKCNKMGVLFYNSLFSAIALFMLFACEHILPIFHSKMEPITRSTIMQVGVFERWGDWQFVLLFTLAALMGSILNYSIFLCTTLNSALTTAVVGCLKNVLTTYVGMLFLGDYAFHWLNFIGLNISIVGSLYYTYITMFRGVAGYGGG